MFRVLLCLAVLLLPVSGAIAEDYTDQESGSVVIYKNGQPMHVNKDDQDIILERIIEAFNHNVENTGVSRILLQKVTRDGSTIEQKWDELKSGNYFSARLNPPEEMYDDSVILDEIIVSIISNPKENPLGMVMAKLKNGKIRAYEIDNKGLINIYCMDKAEKYLPEHYKEFTEKYHSDEYSDSGIECSSEASNETDK